MKKVNHEILLGSERYINNGLLSEEKLDKAIRECLRKVDKNIAKLGELFPTPATFNNAYKPMQNIEWTNGFWTGILWLCYELTNDQKC